MGYEYGWRDFIADAAIDGWTPLEARRLLAKSSGVSVALRTKIMDALISNGKPMRCREIATVTGIHPSRYASMLRDEQRSMTKQGADPSKVYIVRHKHGWLALSNMKVREEA